VLDGPLPLQSAQKSSEFASNFVALSKAFVAGVFAIDGDLARAHQRLEVVVRSCLRPRRRGGCRKGLQAKRNRVLATQSSREAGAQGDESQAFLVPDSLVVWTSVYRQSEREGRKQVVRNPMQELGHTVDLVIMPAVGECENFVQEVGKPGSLPWEIDLAAPDLARLGQQSVLLVALWGAPIGRGIQGGRFALSSCRNSRPKPAFSMSTVSARCSPARPMTLRRSPAAGSRYCPTIFSISVRKGGVSLSFPVQ